ncbi:MAG: glycosyltransferase family 2 protein [Kouleothrix sp.]
MTLTDIERPRTGPTPHVPAPSWPFSISIVIPAMNEGATIAHVIQGVREQLPDAEIVVVDDASRDNTTDVAEAAGARVIRRPYNIGNGAGVKTGVRAATGDVVVIIDADGQMNPADLPRLLQYIGPYDLVIGERDRSGQQNTLRWLGNTALNRFGTYLVGFEMRDLTSGFRAFRRTVMLEFLHLLPNRFSWSTTSAMAFAKAGYHIRFVPIEMRKRQAGQSTQKLMRNGVRFGLIILRIVTLFNPLRVFFPIFIALELLALAAYFWSIASGDRWLHIPPSTGIFFLGGLIIFLFGLISEQIASLRFKGPEQ